jgi:hypothetical protein
MSESRVRENRTHGSMRRREATTASRASTRRAAEEASRRPYNNHYDFLPGKQRLLLGLLAASARGPRDANDLSAARVCQRQDLALELRAAGVAVYARCYAPSVPACQLFRATWAAELSEPYAAGTRELRERLGGRSADAEEPSRVEERTVSDEPDTDEGGAMLLAETGYSFPRV